MHIPESSLKINLKRLAKILVIIFILGLGIQYGPDFYKKTYALSVELLSTKRAIVVGATVIKVDLADTYEKRIQGLSGKEELTKNNGMLFVFDKPGLYGIWMKDMNFAIDIIWFNEFKEVIHLVENATPESYPETFTPPSTSVYILEVPAGFVDGNHIKIGDSIEFL
jgi:uncharacterized membrane protein (UPF0127 family)